MSRSEPGRVEVEYRVTISVPDPEGDGFPPDGVPSEDEVRLAIYRGVDSIDTEDAVEVQRT